MATKRKSNVVKHTLKIELGVNKVSGKLTAGAAKLTSGGLSKKTKTKRKSVAGVAGTKRRKRRKSA